MAQHKHKKPPLAPHTHIPKEERALRRYSRIIPAAVFIFLLFGLGIAFFAVGADPKSLIIGGIIGAICGYFFGHQIAKVLAKK